MIRSNEPTAVADLDLEREGDYPPRRSLVVQKSLNRGGDRARDTDEPFEILSREIVAEVLSYFGRMKPFVIVSQGAAMMMIRGLLIPAAAEEGDLGLAVEEAGLAAGPATVRLSVHGVEFRLEGLLSRAGEQEWLLSNVRL